MGSDSKVREMRRLEISTSHGKKECMLEVPQQPLILPICMKREKASEMTQTHKTRILISLSAKMNLISLPE